MILHWQKNYARFAQPSSYLWFGQDMLMQQRISAPNVTTFIPLRQKTILWRRRFNKKHIR